MIKKGRGAARLAMVAAAVCAVSCLATVPAFGATLDELNAKYRVAVANYNDVLSQQDSNKKEIAKTEAEIRQVELDLQDTQERSGRAAVALYKSTENRDLTIDMLLESNSLTDAIHRYESFERIESYYKETIAETREQKAQLETMVVELEARKVEIEEELADAKQTMDEAEKAVRDADHSDGAKYHQTQGNGSNCGATAFIMGVNTLLHENKYTDNVKVWSDPSFGGDSTVNVTGKSTAWLKSHDLDESIVAYDAVGDIHKTDELRTELEQGHVVVISSGPGSMWQRADGTAAAPGSFPDGHFIMFYYYDSKKGIFYANDSSVSKKQGAGCPYTEKQMQQWLDGRSTHFATILRKL